MAATSVLSPPVPQRMTEQEFLRYSHEGRKVELVNGRVVDVPTEFRHDRIVYNLTLLLAPAARGKGHLPMGQAGFRMSSGNIRVPDSGFMRKDRLPQGQFPQGFTPDAPDLCIEVISPSEEPTEMMQKVREYFASGAELVWQVFPETRTVRIYTSPNVFITLLEDATLTGDNVLPEFECVVADIFAED